MPVNKKYCQSLVDVDVEAGERGVDEPLLPVSGDADVEAGERGVDKTLQGLDHLAVCVLLIETLHLMQHNTPHHSPVTAKGSTVHIIISSRKCMYAST